MKIALVEPYVSINSLQSYAEKTEPSHLLGMYNLLKQAGCDVVLLDAYSLRLSATDLADWIEAQSVTHLGLTVYDYFPCMAYVQALFDCLPENVGTIIGGPGPTYCTDRMLNILKPDWLVKGAGEKRMVDLFRSGFSQKHASCVESKVGPTVVAVGDLMPLDEIPFERPYDLEQYDFQAAPRVQTGCVGLCIFCSGAYQKTFDYVTMDKAERLFDHLVNQKEADVLTPTGPDFTAVPRKANDLLHVLVEGGFRFRAFRPGVRLDTMSRAIDLDSVVWKKLAAMCEISLESSIESFSLSRIKRIGKNLPLNFFGNIFDNLAKIVAACDCKIVLGRIAIDPTLTIDEFILDCDGFRNLLQQFRNRVTVGGMLMNEFVPLFGTPSTERESRDNPWVERRLLDPRMQRLQGELLDNDQFRKWCSLAEQVQEFGERNLVFDEILMVARERANEIRHASV